MISFPNYSRIERRRNRSQYRNGSVEEFVTLIRVYYQAVMAVQLGITNLNILNDMALFKRMLKIPVLRTTSWA